ncbi:MAG TPA: hypothetical protein VG819_11325 [Rhizomicrobium sp.]|jgi:hypothetical protein|nr:hypothetical protein [Rhizomicrobium sp.]
MGSANPLSFVVLAAVALAAAGSPARAVPSFAEQTGQPCSACHVGGFGPQLTPFGRTFKLEGYTMRAGTGFTNPLSAMAIASFVNTADDQPAQPHYDVNNNVTIDQISAFVAGGIGNHFGGFTQWTWDGVGRAFSWDNIDLRVSDHATVAGGDLLFGMSLNNSPGVEDAWNTLAAWGFPYSGSDLAPAPAAATMFDGSLAQSVLGASAFAMWNSSLYLETGLYWTPSHNFLSAMGTDEGPGPIDGAAPYVRAAYQKDYGNQNFEIGAFAFLPDILPGGDTSTGRTDSYSDVGIDGSYQYLAGGDIYSLNARYSHEQQDLNASWLLGGAAHRSNTLEDFRLDASYYWQNTIGGTVQFFDTWGSPDAVLYAGNPGFRPDSTGVTFQVDGTLFGRDMDVLDGRFNVRAGLQYTVYSRFDGGSGNASGNDTLRLFLWTAL